MSKEKNNKSESQPEEELRCDEKQYELLKRCSKSGNISPWNEWREKNFDEEIWLQGADLFKAKLQGADLEHANLKGANLWNANLQRTDLGEADLRGAKLRGAKLQKAYLINTNLQGANLQFANLQGTDLAEVNLQGADLFKANLQGADLLGAHLENTDFVLAHLEGAKFKMSHLQRAKFNCVFVNSSTSFIGCYIDENTDFRDMSLDSLQSKSGTKYLLKYNIRRLNWEDWYKDHSRLKWLVKTFWSISDYGRSTGRVVGTFFILALFFAAVYANCAYWWPPGAVSYLAVEPHFPLWHYFLLVLLRPVYFSVVTMTTLGFGDMHAHVQSVLGHILLTIQVLFGYVLLGALVTRLAVLFTADGPEGSFTPMDKETKELLAKLKEDKKKAST